MFLAVNYCCKAFCRRMLMLRKVIFKVNINIPERHDMALGLFSNLASYIKRI